MNLVDPFGTPSTGPFGSGKGSLGRDYRRLALSQAIVVSNVNSRLTATPTDGGEGTGIQFSLTGGWTSTDWTGAWPYILWELIGHDGAVLGGDDQFTLDTILRIRTHPGDSSDTDLRIGLVNESDLTTGTVDAVGTGIRWTGAARVAISALATNGTVGTINAGGAVAGAEYMQGSMSRQGKGASSIICTARVCLLDSTGAYIASSNVNAAPVNGIPLGNPTKFYVALMLGRTATTAGTVTLAVDAYVNRPTRKRLPT